MASGLLVAFALAGSAAYAEPLPTPPAVTTSPPAVAVFTTDDQLEAEMLGAKPMIFVLCDAADCQQYAKLLAEVAETTAEFRFAIGWEKNLPEFTLGWDSLARTWCWRNQVSSAPGTCDHPPHPIFAIFKGDGVNGEISEELHRGPLDEAGLSKLIAQALEVVKTRLREIEADNAAEKAAKAAKKAAGH